MGYDYLWYFRSCSDSSGIGITMATGGALGDFGIGMAASGVMDIYKSIESVINNTPIDMKQYFSRRP